MTYIILIYMPSYWSRYSLNRRDSNRMLQVERSTMKQIISINQTVKKMCSDYLVFIPFKKHMIDIL